MDYKEILNRLWDDYQSVNPSVNKIHSVLKGHSEKILNDHIAFRTFNVKGIDINALSEVFKRVGYIEKESYIFREKKLNAKHYEHGNDPFAPKIFISELITSEFSTFVQNIAHEVAQKALSKSALHEDLVFRLNAWEPLSYEVYEELRGESEYAAWFYVFGFRANHFTVSVNHLKHIGGIEELNGLLKQEGFELNHSGGEIKGGKDVFLKQSSTLADKIMVEFAEGSKEVPCCYYEFAERFRMPDGKLFSGFIAKSADKIFESTNSR